MKKLFTVLVLLTFFIGVKADGIIDAEFDFSKYTDISEVKFASWGGSESATARVSIKDGCLHFESTETTDPSWDCQFFPFGGVDAEPGIVYTLHKEKRPVEWIEQLTNGDASKSWEDPNTRFDDKTMNFTICAWGKEKGRNMNENDGWDPFPADIEEVDGNRVFVVHAKDATTEGDASAWDNQFWIESPKMLKIGSQFILRFRYKASQAAKTNTLFNHQNPSDYVHWQAVGDVNFTTEWQVFDGVFTVPDAATDAWSIAFNLNPEVKTATDFYFDDLSLSLMKLDEGLFVAAANTTTGSEYDFDSAIEFTPAKDGLVVATVGTKGKKDTWMNEVMISTVRGNDKAFKGATIKPTGLVVNDPDTWLDYTEGSNCKIKLPTAGVWTISIDPEGKQINFVKVEDDVPYNNDYDIWSLAGDHELFGSDWDITDTKNRMGSNDGVNYTLIRTDVKLEKGTYRFKVAKDYAWDISYPEDYAELVIDENATYKITFTFNAETHQLSAVAEKTDGIYYNFITKGKIAEVIQNPNKYKGKVIIPATVMHEGVEYDVKSIGSQAFYNCSGLTSVTIPNSVTSIGENAFFGCSGLTTVNIPNSVTSIGSYAFQSCSGLTSVTIPNSVTSIGSFAFYGCSGLTTVNIPNSVTSIGSYAFGYCSGLTSVTIPNSVTSIGSSAFEFCSGLTSVNIPNSVTSIGVSAFEFCSGLTSVNIPNSVTVIGSYTFRGCIGLISINIPNSVKTIANGAFSSCSGLTSVTIGNSVTYIYNGAFSECKLLADVYCLAEQVKENNSYDSQGLYTHPEAFVDSYQDYITLHVPAASIEAYKAIVPWKNFKEVVALDGEDIPATPKCATPTISYIDGKLDFTCETEGVDFISEVIAEDAKKYYDASVTLSQTYKVTVYATKAGFENSDVATREIVIENGQTSLFGDLNKDGKVNVADHVKLSDIIMNK